MIGTAFRISVEGGEAAVEQLNRAGEAGKAAFDKLRAAVDAVDPALRRQAETINRTADELKSRYEPLLRLEQERGRINQALAADAISRATAERALADALQRAEQQEKALNAAQKGVGGGLSPQQGRELQNAAFQATDFIVQVASGQGMLRAFTQQVPQALGGFGALGAVLGAVAAGAGALVAAMSGVFDPLGRATEQAKTQKDALDGLYQALNVTASSATSFAGSISALDSRQRDLVGANLAETVAAEQKQLEAATKAASDYGESLAKTAQRTAPAATQAATENFDPKQSTAMQAGLASLDTATTKAREVFAAYQEGAATYGQVRTQIEILNVATGGSAEALTAQARKMLELTDATESVRQSLGLHTAQLHLFLELSGQATGAVDDIDRKFLTQTEVASQAAAALQKYNLGLRESIIIQTAASLRGTNEPGAQDAARNYEIEARAQLNQDREQIERDRAKNAIVVDFKVDPSEAQKAIALVDQARTKTTEGFDQQAKLIQAAGRETGASAETVQRALDLARKSYDETAKSAQHAADVQKLVAQGMDRAKAERAATEAESAGPQGDQRVQLEAKLKELQADRAAGVNIEGGYEQRVKAVKAEIAKIDEQRARTAQSQADSIERQREGLLAQESPEAALLAGEEKIARFRAENPRKFSAADAAAAVEGEADKYVKAIESQTEAANRGASAREVAQAKINALQEAEAKHGEVRVAADQEIVNLRSQIVNLDEKDTEKMQQQTAEIERSLAKGEAQLANLQARGGGSIALAIKEAREAADASVQRLTPEQLALPGGPAEEARREADAKSKADNQEKIVLQQQYNAVLTQTQTPLQAYADKMGHLEELRARDTKGVVDWTRAVIGALDPLQTLAEEEEVIEAKVMAVNDAYAAGRIPLAQRNRDLAQLAASEKAARDAALQAQIRGALADQNPLRGGATAGALQVFGEIQNASETVAKTVTDMFHGMEDSVISFAKTGKLNMADFASTVEDDMLRMALRLAENAIITQLFSGFVGGAGAATGTVTTSGSLTGSAMTPITLRHEGGPADAGATARYLYHDGGPAGSSGRSMLLPGEFPAVLRQGETVDRDGSAGAPLVQVVDQRGASAPPVEVSRQQQRDGSHQIRLLIREEVRGLVGSGQLDRQMGARYGTRPQASA